MGKSQQELWSIFQMINSTDPESILLGLTLLQSCLNWQYFKKKEIKALNPIISSMLNTWNPQVLSLMIQLKSLRNQESGTNNFVSYINKIIINKCYKSKLKHDSI